MCDIKGSFFSCAKFKMTLRQINGNVKETSSCVSLEFRREIKTAKKRGGIISIEMRSEGTASEEIFKVKKAQC